MIDILKQILEIRIRVICNMYLTVQNSFMEINNRRTGSKNITLRNGNVKRYGFDEMYMKKYLVEGKLYQIIDQLK